MPGMLPVNWTSGEKLNVRVTNRSNDPVIGAGRATVTPAGAPETPRLTLEYTAIVFLIAVSIAPTIVVGSNVPRSDPPVAAVIRIA